ncbi:VWA domain-containing protein [Glutamicibacter soli]|uniref:VWA domain-containing protein n=1 Tax=Glutamicibacter soli TaxID=453836 RepID=A0A6L9G460_9MICC|nr:SpaA isopeptide-forming pilin-related protein [Glutamicibacter soli]NAZ16024.1 VWA domain-containing protein [Glutamicibacter soli]
MIGNQSGDRAAQNSRTLGQMRAMGWQRTSNPRRAIIALAALFSTTVLVLTLLVGFGPIPAAAQTPENSQADGTPTVREETSDTSAESTLEASEAPVATLSEPGNESDSNPIAQNYPRPDDNLTEESIAVEDRPAPVSKASAMASRLANPQLPAQCGLSVAIVLDLSNSLTNGDVASSKTAAQGVVNALTGTPSAVGVYTFASLAPDGTNTALSKTSVSTSRGATIVKNSIAGIKRVPENHGGTNWDAALRQVPSGQYDVVLFVTDGNPTAYGTPNPNRLVATPTGNVDMGSAFHAIDLSTAVRAADKLKASGSFVMGLGVGAGVNVSNIKDISGSTEGTDYFRIANYAELTQKLSEIALKNCQGTVSIVKQVRDLSGKLAPTAGWTFDGRSVDKVEPLSAVTAKNGAVNFKVTDLKNDRRTIQFAERQQLGYALEQQSGSNAVCIDNVTGKKVSVSNVGATGFAVDVDRENALSCQVLNRMIPAEPIVGKSSNPSSGTEVQPGDEIEYKLTFTAEGTFPVDIDYVDHLAGVLDDADLIAGSIKADSGLVAVLNANKINVTGTVSPDKPLILTYKVKVKTENFGDGIAANFIVPSGETPPETCEPDDPSCTEHPISGDLSISKTSDPESGTLVAPGQTVNYTLKFANSGAAEVEVDHRDFLRDVLDDAEYVDRSLRATNGLDASLRGDQIVITGKVGAESEATVTYSVKIKTAELGNGVVKNFLVPDGEDPVCDPEVTNCTEHPVLGTAIWTKSDVNGAALSGSEWELTGPGTNGTKVAIEDCVASAASKCSGADMDPKAGGFQLTDLAWGTYTLIETKAPAGFVLDESKHAFTVGGESPAQIVWDLGKITNEQREGLDLPLTGGTGTQTFLFGGGAVLLAALGVVAWRRKTTVPKN